MLLQFKFKNHKCFYDETILDLTATMEKRHILSTININDNNILPIIEIHGANASGKTSLIEALSFMINIIKNSSQIDITNDLPVVPFAFSETSKTKNSEYELSIALGDYEYRYGFSVNKKGFTEEWLYKKKFSKNSNTTQKTIFERVNNKITFSKSYNNSFKTWNLFGNNKNLNINKLLVLTTVALKEEDGVFREIYNYINKINFKIENIFENQISINLLNQNHSIFKKFQKILNEFDPCLLGIQIDKINDDYYKVSGIHKNIDNDNNILIPIQNESAGTYKIFNILPIILVNLEVGGVLCIDELDTKFHPLLYKKIVNMYKDKQINKNNAQLIFTAHSTFLLDSDILRRDEIYLVEKDMSGMSKLYSLSEFKNLRVDADYEKKYLTGQLGAIPYEDE